MDNAERITILETRVREIDGAIRDIREEQEAARERDTGRQVEMGKLTVLLETLTKALADHNTWHDKNKAHAFNVANITVSVCALGVLVVELLKNIH
jgi:hypothetical protein